MNINVSQCEFKMAIEKAEKIIRKISIPALECVLVKAENDKITLTAYNLNSAIIVNVNGKVYEPGSILIDKSNFNLIKKLSGALHIISTDNNVEVIANRKLKFSSLPVEDYPEIHNKFNLEAFVIDENKFKNSLKVKSFAGKEFSLAVLNSVAIVNNYIYACNSYIMARIKLDIKNNCQHNIIIPIQSAIELDKILNKKSNKKLKFSCYYNNEEVQYLKIATDDFTYITKLMVQKLPDYNGVIPNSFNTVVYVNKDRLQDTVDYVKEIVKEHKDNPVLFKIDGQLEFCTSAKLNKSMSEIIPAEIKGNSTTVAFNNSYIETILKTIDDKEININIRDNKSPVIIIGENNQDELYLVMPLRIVA